MTCFISTINTLVLWFQMEVKDDRLVFLFSHDLQRIEKDSRHKARKQEIASRVESFYFHAISLDSL